VLTIALGAGLNGALCLAINAAFLRPPDLAHAEEVVRVDDGRPGAGLTYPDYVDYRDRAARGVNLAAFAGLRLTARVPGGGAPHRVLSITVSGNYFDVLGARPLLGRTFTGAEDLPPLGTPVVVLGEDYWARRFNRDPDVIGKTIELNLRPFTIVGVVPAGFRGIEQPGSAPHRERIWIPLWTRPLVRPGDRLLLQRDAWWELQIAGRLLRGFHRPGAPGDRPGGR
jgi:hypothetical protein